MRGPLGQTFPASPPLTATKLDSNGSSVVSTPHELPERELYGDLFPNIPAWNPQDNTLLQSQTPSIDEILAGLPTKEQSEVLIWSYMGGYHAKRSLFHGPSFLVQVRKFQHWSVAALCQSSARVLTHLQVRYARSELSTQRALSFIAHCCALRWISSVPSLPSPNRVWQHQS